MNSDKPPLLHEPASHFRDYVAIVRKRVWTVAAIFVIVVTLVAIWSFKATPIYRATARILIDFHDPKVVTFEEVLGRELGSAEAYATQYQLIRGLTLAKRVVAALQLQGREGYGVPPKDGPGPLAELSQFIIRLVRGSAAGEAGPDQRKNNEELALSPEERATRAFSGRLKIEPVSRSRLVDVQFNDSDPVLAAKIVNTLTELYLQMALELRFTATKEASTWLSKEMGKVREGVVNADQALQGYKEKHNLVSLEERQNITLQKLGELNSTVTKARTERIEMEVLAKRVQQADGDIEALASLPDVISNPVIQKLKGEYIGLFRDHSEQSKRYKEQHPRILRVLSQLTTTKKKLDDEMKEIAKNILTRYQVAVARENSLVRSLEEQKQAALNLNRLEIQYQALKRESETNRKLYEDMLKRTKETDLMEGLRSSNIRVVDPAEVPKQPVSPRKTQNILLGMGGGLFLGVALVFLLDHLDRRIRTVEEAESIAGAPMVGAVPDLKGRVSGRGGMHGAEKKAPDFVSEYFREIRAMAAFRLGKTHKVVQITSCVPREGKTLISANLALALSQAGKKVLLVDGDFHRAGLRDWFRIRSGPGLAQALLGEAKLADTVYPFPKSRLSIIPAGRRKGTSSKIFESSDLRSVLDSFRADFDYVVVDSPPLLAVSDPLVWSQSVDGIFFVVDVMQVNGDMLRQAVSKVRELNTPILGVIMNRMTRHHNYYYYGYYKKYDYYYRKSKREEGSESVA